MKMEREILTSTVEAYGRDILRFGEFEGALLASGVQAEKVVAVTNELLKRHEIGRMSFRKIRKNKPSKRSFIAITTETKRN